jgi:hypothetical protein
MSNSAATQAQYSELVTPKWTSFLPLALILPTLWLTFAPINALVGITLGAIGTLVVAWLMLANSFKIVVSANVIRVGKASIETRFIGVCKEVPFASRFAQRIPNLDPRAFLKLKNSQKGLVKLEIVDKKDPTPYWVVSTKHPGQLIAAIEQAKKAL